MSSAVAAPSSSEVLAGSLNPEQCHAIAGNASVQARSAAFHLNASVQAGGSMASSRSRQQGNCIPFDISVEMKLKQPLPEDKAISYTGKWLSSISSQRARSAQYSARDNASSCTGKWLSSMASQEACSMKCPVIEKASSSARRSSTSKRPATVATLPSRPADAEGLLPTLHQHLWQPSSQRDPAVLPPAGGRLPFRVRSVRSFPSAPNQQSVVDQIVFGQDMDFSGEEKFDQGYLCLFNGCAGRASWDGCTGDVAECRFEEEPKKSRRAVEGSEQEVKPRRQGKMLVPDAPAQKSVVDTVVFDRDMDNSGDAQFQAAYLGMFHGSAGKPSHFLSPRGLKRVPVPGSVADSFPISLPRATTAPLSISPRRRRCQGGRLQKISVGAAHTRQPRSARVH